MNEGRTTVNCLFLKLPEGIKKKRERERGGRLRDRIRKVRSKCQGRGTWGCEEWGQDHAQARSQTTQGLREIR